MLSQARLERLRGYLLDEQTSLRQQLANVGIDAPDVNVGLGNHMAEDATAAFDQAAGIALRRRKQLVLDQLQRALARMEAGRYGYCERCHEEIDFARLKAIPHASLCMSCQKLVEF